MNISLRDTNLFLNKPIWRMAAGALLLGGLLLGGCKKSQESTVAPASGNGLVKIRVGYIGLTCEAPIYMAVEKGFFKEEGWDPVLVKCDWSNYKDVMALEGFDITHHLVMYFLKPIEQGLDIKFTGGIHRGRLRVQAAVNGKINSVADLRGKTNRHSRHGNAALHLCQPGAHRPRHRSVQGNHLDCFSGGRTGIGLGQG